MKTRILLCGLIGASTALLGAAPLTQSTFTEVVHDVNVVAEPSKTATPARVNELFQTPNLVRTGGDSRAELTAPDQTITRIGANTVFSFEPPDATSTWNKAAFCSIHPAAKAVEPSKAAALLLLFSAPP